MEQEHTNTVLTAAVLSATLVIGLIFGFSLADLARSKLSSKLSSGENLTLPQHQGGKRQFLQNS